MRAVRSKRSGPACLGADRPCCGAGAIQVERFGDLAGRAGRSRRERGGRCAGPEGAGRPGSQDRKSTRLNSSHLVISYAVFCLKKKKKKKYNKSLIKKKKN